MDKIAYFRAREIQEQLEKLNEQIEVMEFFSIPNNPFYFVVSKELIEKFRIDVIAEIKQKIQEYETEMEKL